MTARENDVWRMLIRGASGHEIAAELHLGEATVKAHVSRLLAKLGAQDWVQLVVLDFEAGLR